MKATILLEFESHEEMLRYVLTLNPEIKVTYQPETPLRRMAPKEDVDEALRSSITMSKMNPFDTRIDIKGPTADSGPLRSHNKVEEVDSPFPAESIPGITPDSIWKQGDPGKPGVVDFKCDPDLTLDKKSGTKIPVQKICKHCHTVFTADHNRVKWCDKCKKQKEDEVTLKKEKRLQALAEKVGEKYPVSGEQEA